MVFGVAQVTDFFEENDQMGLSHRTCLHLQSEGVVSPEDIIDFTVSDSWKQIIENCKRPTRIPDPNNAGKKFHRKIFSFLLSL